MPTQTNPEALAQLKRLAETDLEDSAKQVQAVCMHLASVAQAVSDAAAAGNHLPHVGMNDDPIGQLGPDLHRACVLYAAAARQAVRLRWLESVS